MEQNQIVIEVSISTGQWGNNQRMTINETINLARPVTLSDVARLLQGIKDAIPVSVGTK
jgi:hypothetical protein